MASELICATCGSRTHGRPATKGATLIELILWCCFIVPGLIYTVWRRTNVPVVCGACGAAGLVPLNTPVGQKLVAEHPQSSMTSTEVTGGISTLGGVVLTVLGTFMILAVVASMSDGSHTNAASSSTRAHDVDQQSSENAVAVLNRQRTARLFITTRADDAHAACIGPWMSQYEGSDDYRAICDSYIAPVRKRLDDEGKPCDSIYDLWVAVGITAIDCVVHDAPDDPTGNRTIRYEARGGVVKEVTQVQWDFDRRQALGY